MSHLTTDNKNVSAADDKAMNPLVPPQEEKRQAETGSTPLAQKGAEYIRDQATRLPLDLHSDADPARDKAVSDSVRAGFVDDVGIDESRRIIPEKQV